MGYIDAPAGNPAFSTSSDLIPLAKIFNTVCSVAKYFASKPLNTYSEKKTKILPARKEEGTSGFGMSCSNEPLKPAVLRGEGICSGVHSNGDCAALA